MPLSKTFSPLGAFLPAGDLWNRLQRNFARLEEEKYWPQNLFQREKQAEKWPGDTEGRTLLAWILLAQVNGRAPRYLGETLARWPSELNDRGYFGKIYTDAISEQQLSSHGWVLQALSELHRWRPGSQARQLAQPIIDNLFLPTSGHYAAYSIEPSEREAAGAYSGSHLKQVGPWILSTDVGCFAIGMTGLIDACEAFGLQPQLTPLIEEMMDLFLKIDLAALQAQTHATLTACRGLIRWAKLTGRTDFYAEAEKRYRQYADLAWTETYANFNWFGRPRWTEPCAMVDSLMVAMELWIHTDDPIFLEHAHLIWFNALGHGQRANGGFGCDNCPGADGEADLFFKTPESHWCCTMRGAEGLSRFCQYQAIVDGDTLILPFLLPGDLDLEGLRLKIGSNYPLAAQATIECQSDRAPIKTLRVFLPSWMKSPQASAPIQGQWLVEPIEKAQTITLQAQLEETRRPLLSSTRHYIASTKDTRLGEFHVHQRGPLLLASPGGAADAETPSGNLVPIFQAYLDGNMNPKRSHRRLLFAESPKR